MDLRHALPQLLSDKDTVKVTILPPVPFIVLRPDNGDTIYTGRQYRVVWQVYPPTGMHVELSTNAGLTFDRQNETKIDEFDTSWLGDVPDTLPESDSCLIRVREYGHAIIHTISGYFYLRKGTNNAVVPRAARVPGVVRIAAGAFSADGRRCDLTNSPTGSHVVVCGEQTPVSQRRKSSSRSNTIL